MIKTKTLLARTLAAVNKPVAMKPGQNVQIYPDNMIYFNLQTGTLPTFKKLCRQFFLNLALGFIL